MKFNQQMKTILPLAVLAGFAVTANAAVIITPTGATSSVGNLSSRPIGLTIDGSGLSGVGDILTQTHETTGGGNKYWIGAGTTDITLDFDLNDIANVDTFDVDSIHLWNYAPGNNTTDRGVGTVDIYFSTDNGGTYTLTPVTVTFTELAINTPAPSETKTFSEVSGVTNIRLVADNLGSGTHTAFSEIRFGSVVPEPSTTALLGLGGLALILRRRK